MSDDDWTETFTLNVRYEMQLTEGYRQSLAEGFASGDLTEQAVADEISSMLTSTHVNIVDADAELDFIEDVIGGSGA